MALLQLELMELRQQQQDMEDFTKQEQGSDSRSANGSARSSLVW